MSSHVKAAVAEGAALQGPHGALAREAPKEQNFWNEINTAWLAFR